MVGKAKMTLSSIAIDNIIARREGQLGHTFTVKAKVKVSKRSLGAISGEGIDSLTLEWKETIDWFEQDAKGTWQHKGTVAKDMYAENPRSNTFRNWEESRYFFATVTELNRTPPALVAAIKAANGKTRADDDKAAKHWIADNGFEWTIPITDVPAIGLNPQAGVSGGGGGASLVQTNSRRRVAYFDLGFKGTSPRVTATQIVETVKGRPTICEFIVPAIRKADADDPRKLQAWRANIH